MITVSPSPACRRPAVVRGRRSRVVGPRLGVLGGDDLLAIAEGLAPAARRWRGWDRLAARSWHLAAASDRFEAWIIGWPADGHIELHDHGHSAAAVVVAEGALVETTVTEAGDGFVTTATSEMTTGSSWTMGRRHVHDIVNEGPLPAVSVHVYAPRLTSMTSYRLADGILRSQGTVHYRLGDVVP